MSESAQEYYAFSFKLISLSEDKHARIPWSNDTWMTPGDKKGVLSLTQ